MSARAVASTLMATCLVLAVALWPSKVVRAAPIDDCIAGLPEDLATQLQPLIQALCEASQSGASGLAPPSQQQQQQQDLQLIAEAMALLAMADPGYGYAPPGYGYAPPSDGPPAACGSGP